MDRSLDKVDASEIRHENQLRLVVFLFIYKVLAPSQVVQDFFHQQYYSKLKQAIDLIYVCFNWMMVPSLRMENGWKSPVPSIQKKTGWLSGTKFYHLDGLIS